MAQVLDIGFGVVLGLGLIAGVFWLAFRRLPEAREAPFATTQVTEWADPGPGPQDGGGA